MSVSLSFHSHFSATNQPISCSLFRFFSISEHFNFIRHPTRTGALAMRFKRITYVCSFLKTPRSFRNVAFFCVPKNRSRKQRFDPPRAGKPGQTASAKQLYKNVFETLIFCSSNTRHTFSQSGQPTQSDAKTDNCN